MDYVYKMGDYYVRGLNSENKFLKCYILEVGSLIIKIYDKIRVNFAFYFLLMKKDIWSIRDDIKADATSEKKKKLLTAINHRYFFRYGSWIGQNATFGGKPFFPHGPMGIFISNDAVIGKNAIIFQQVTIGSNQLDDSKNKGAPIIGDNVYIGAGAKIIGNIVIGNNVRIGAGTVVCKNVPDNCVVVSGDVRIIQKDKLDNRYYQYDELGYKCFYDDGIWKRIK